MGITNIEALYIKWAESDQSKSWQDTIEEKADEILSEGEEDNDEQEDE